MSEAPEQRVLRIELATMIGSAIVGGGLLPFGGTPARMSTFLLGWAGGCALHLLTRAAGKRMRRGRQR